jgi:hypothetical protein
VLSRPAVDLLYSHGVVVSCLLLNTICENKKINHARQK